MEFERYIPQLKKYDSILFLHQPMTSGQPLKIVQRHMAHPVYVYLCLLTGSIISDMGPKSLKIRTSRYFKT